MKIVEQFEADGRPLVPPRIALLDGESALRVASLFPGAGSRTLFPMLSPYLSRYKVFLIDADGKEIAVRVNSSLTLWSDNKGGAHSLNPMAGQILDEAFRPTSQP